MNNLFIFMTFIYRYMVVIKVGKPTELVVQVEDVPVFEIPPLRPSAPLRQSHHHLHGRLPTAVALAQPMMHSTTSLNTQSSIGSKGVFWNSSYLALNHERRTDIISILYSRRCHNPQSCQRTLKLISIPLIPSF
jgi:hypothetical protein